MTAKNELFTIDALADRRRGRTSSVKPMRAVPRASSQHALADARRCLSDAMRAGEPADRFASAHLAALRAAAALLAVLPRPAPRRGRSASVWEQLDRVVPELSGWSAYFAAGSAKRRAAEAGITRLVSAADAEEQIRRSIEFLDVIEAHFRVAA